jgi:acetyltransferase-like isoleucine patch superfamily enzyme
MIIQLLHFYKFLQRRWNIYYDPVGYARSLGVNIGKECRLLDIDIGTFGSEPYLVQLGDHVTVTSGVRFVTHDGGVWVFRQQYPDIDVIAPIVIGNNVFIGLNVILMPGITIGDNCIIGAGSIVTKNIPANHVAVGVPARPIKLTTDYLESIKNKAIYIRTLNQSEKKKLLIEKYLERSKHDSLL